MLVDSYSSVLDDEGKRICSVIQDSAKQMGRLIDDLLAFSRAGRTKLAFSDVNSELMVKSVFFDITTDKEKSRIDFRVEPLPVVTGDPNLIKQVWTNLISNAVKFTSKKERAVITVSADLQGEMVVFSINDNGAGFDMQYADKLFGVFERLHSLKEFPGTGVGLAIVQRIIQRHGGKIWAYSEVGKGATFSFTLKKRD
jgi:light-regulated signal transduction histidine kinase (bacteriophytochrome)